MYMIDSLDEFAVIRNPKKATTLNVVCFCTEIWNWPSGRFLQSSVYTEGVHLPLGQDMDSITLQLYAATSVSAYTVRPLEVV